MFKRLCGAAMAVALIGFSGAGHAAPQDSASPAPAPQATPAPVIRDADPALWVVKDKDTTIYLFGTIHVLKPGLSWFDEAVRKAFDASNTLVLEMKMPDQAAMQALVTKLAVDPDGPPLTDKIPAGKDRTEYANAMTGLGLPPTAFDRYDPWFASISLTMLPMVKLGYRPDQGPETVLTAAAEKDGKQIVGLETAEQQFGYFDHLSQKAQIDMLMSTIEQMPELPGMMNRMVDYWAKGDPKDLAKELNEGMEDQPELTRILLTDRNIRWAHWIKQRMAKPGTVFIAVGAGHLAGANSVQMQLKKEGLKARRIRY
ncbi:TraB/GumN family protein [Stakelama sediminis]|uniref:TraB/GumN family protein n=1 Tax=Stakelama sediminis TaxID=463200 RepID=A0A840YWH6_9SPHN|nr:TraB/GumN family protein [Stakelama sediminis]MBB5717886.1 hypothetical protein [Stakelama sediminis]